MFEELEPIERECFTAVVKADAQSRGFNLDDLVAAKADDGLECPHCHNREPEMIVKFGVRQGIQRYRCKACSKMFSSTTGTFLSWTKKNFFTWKTFFKSMMEGHSVRKAADVCKIHKNTAFMWRHKILDALAQYHDSQRRMTGIVEADDTLFPVSYKGSKPLGRDSYKRGTPASKSGASKEKVVVSCAVSRNGRIFSKVSALGRASAKAFKAVFRNRFSKRAIICTDNDRAFAKYAAKRDFTHCPLNGTTARHGVYCIQNVNSYHSRLKGFIRKFKGISTKYLNNYLVWCNTRLQSIGI